MTTRSTPKPAASGAATPERLDGVVLGLLVGLVEPGVPLVSYAGNPGKEAVRARAIAPILATDVGRQVALLFEGGDASRPIVVGCIQLPGQARPVAPSESAQLLLDQEAVVISASQQLVLRCGKASITLTSAGKVLVRGTYLSSRSSGVNRIKGGSVQLN